MLGIFSQSYELKMDGFINLDTWNIENEKVSFDQNLQAHESIFNPLYLFLQ